MRFGRVLGALMVAAGGLAFSSSASAGVNGVGYVGDQTVAVDVTVNGGPAAVSDITVEVYDADSGTLVGSGSDPSENDCTDPDVPPQVAAQSCFLETDLAAPAGYQLGAVLPTGYVVSSVSCSSFFPLNTDERFAAGVGEFGIDFETPVRCELVVTYVTGQVKADLIVINDDGGTADGSEFTIEVFGAGGTLVDSAPDPAPNDPSQSAMFELPLGDYAFGVMGPDGYEYTAEVTVEVGREIIDDPSAEFSVEERLTVLGVLTADDVAQETTTTTAPPTTAPPTTAAPTTAAPTTAPPAPPTTISGNLPATGATSQTLPIALLAFGLIAFGGGAVLATRRR